MRFVSSRLLRAALAAVVFSPLALAPAAAHADIWSDPTFQVLFVMMLWKNQQAQYGKVDSTAYKQAQTAQTSILPSYFTSAPIFSVASAEQLANDPNYASARVGNAGSLSNSSWNYQSQLNTSVNYAWQDTLIQAGSNDPGFYPASVRAAPKRAAGQSGAEVGVLAVSESESAEPDVQAGEETASSTAQNAPFATAMDAPSPAAVKLYFRTTKYANGTFLVNCYTDSQRTHYVGYKMVDAPRWSGKEGTYPVLIAGYSDLTINGLHTIGYSGYAMNDAKGTAGQMAILHYDSAGRTYTRLMQVNGGASAGKVSIQSGSSAVSLAYVKDSHKDFLYQISNSSGMVITSEVDANSSGWLEVDYRGNYQVGIQWYSNLTGYYQFAGGRWNYFNNLFSLL